MKSLKLNMYKFLKWRFLPEGSGKNDIFKLIALSMMEKGKLEVTISEIWHGCTYVPTSLIDNWSDVGYSNPSRVFNVKCEPHLAVDISDQVKFVKRKDRLKSYFTVKIKEKL